MSPSPPLRRKAVALLSGGLDSALAVKVVTEQGIEVTALRFLTHFGCDAGGGGSCGHDVTGLAKELGVQVKLCHLGDPYVEMVRQPKFGRGLNMNPCVDCRVFMIAWAADILKDLEASFVITGEVLNQRPMSQTRDRFRQIDRALGLEGFVLRPLSAKLLDPTVPEREGIVDRERLLDLRGRSRRRQYELAAKYGIKDFGQPAGGCLLTDPGYSLRLRELWDHDPHAGVFDIQLLRVGRHFRLAPRAKAVVGRNEGENLAIEALARPGDALLALRDVPGPTTLLRGEFGEAQINEAARLTVRYGDAAQIPAPILVRRDGCERVVWTDRAGPERIDALRIAAR